MRREPKQPRARQTADKFLDAFALLLKRKGYHDTTVVQIAEAAGLSQGAFMTRFGSKRVALGFLFQRFCDDVLAALDAETLRPPAYRVELVALFRKLSALYESLVLTHWGANRAMHEVFLKEGVIDPQTREIFKATVSRLHPLLCAYLKRDLEVHRTSAVVQLLVTLNYNHALRAMPGLPSNPAERHALIAEAMMVPLNALR